MKEPNRTQNLKGREDRYEEQRDTKKSTREGDRNKSRRDSRDVHGKESRQGDREKPRNRERHLEGKEIRERDRDMHGERNFHNKPSRGIDGESPMSRDLKQGPRDRAHPGETRKREAEKRPREMEKFHQFDDQQESYGRINTFQEHSPAYRREDLPPAPPQPRGHSPAYRREDLPPAPPQPRGHSPAYSTPQPVHRKRGPGPHRDSSPPPKIRYVLLFF